MGAGADGIIVSTRHYRPSLLAVLAVIVIIVVIRYDGPIDANARDPRHIVAFVVLPFVSTSSAHRRYRSKEGRASSNRWTMGEDVIVVVVVDGRWTTNAATRRLGFGWVDNNIIGDDSFADPRTVIANDDVVIVTTDSDFGKGHHLGERQEHFDG